MFFFVFFLLYWNRFTVLTVLLQGLCSDSFIFSSEYDGQLAPTKAMAAAYLDPNLTHALNQGVKPRFSAGMERTAGPLERVLRVFHYFESSSEPCTWASNIRHGDSTDVRVSLQISWVTLLMFSRI